MGSGEILEWGWVSVQAPQGVGDNQDGVGVQKLERLTVKDQRKEAGAAERTDDDVCR